MNFSSKNIRDVKTERLQSTAFISDIFYDALLCFGQVPNCVRQQRQCHSRQFRWLLARKLDGNFLFVNVDNELCQLPF